MYNLRRFKGFYVGVAMFTMLSSFSYAQPTLKDSPYPADDRVYEHLNVLASVDNARVTGFEGEHKAADYIAQQFEDYDLIIDRQEFPVTAFLDEGSKLIIDSLDGKEIETKNFTYTPATPSEGISADIVFANLGSEEDFTNIDVKGKIALIKRGAYTFYDKVQNAAKAGAIGVIIFNNSEGMISGTLGQISDIPALAIMQEDGEALKAILDKGELIKVCMKIDTQVKDSYSENVIGTLYAQKNARNAKTVIIGAHMDCVDTPGANDNCSGVTGLLELARASQMLKLNYNVKFVAFGAEEIGLVGSQKYVESLSQEEKDNIACMINMDMIGVGETLGIMTATDNSNTYMADLAEKCTKELGYNYDRSVEDRSDHTSFDTVGIPSVHFDYHIDQNYHTDEDSIDKIDSMNVLNVYSVVLNMLRDLEKEMPTDQKDKVIKTMKSFNRFDLGNKSKNGEFYIK
ncbi:M20/M25/M40 family metallo-hydrolase [Tepidibacter aestuarii]|uniref:M20/M25/M40 family metallo-hydrolase n=1 Tax=Tepidibacter aestuarii TaxID=2925782 RepID=UPI0020BEAA01|nr:M20/M25/M40 family metallo-hydrolase [Tepidibacter aestuarii]CAH2212477.1 aminopeptidase YwaD [Tepidibacter aestuarii]